MQPVKTGKIEPGFESLDTETLLRKENTRFCKHVALSPCKNVYRGAADKMSTLQVTTLAFSREYQKTAATNPQQ
jgi:hypothetical protein